MRTRWKELRRSIRWTTNRQTVKDMKPKRQTNWRNYNSKEKELIEAINIDGFTCLDIGFNYGWWSYLFLNYIGKKGKVYAWEPNKLLYDDILAKWPFSNLTGYNYALSDKTGLQDYHVYGWSGRMAGMNSLEKRKERQEKS